MNFKRYKKYIVVNEDRQPMLFAQFNKTEGQFCFAQTHLARQPFPIETYSYEKAKELIRKTVEYRTKKGFECSDYYLMPVK